MFKKLAIFLLLANMVTTLVVGYSVYTNFPEGKAYKIELENPNNEEFEENIYKGVSMIMQGQSQLVLNQHQLSQAIYRVHHFVKPHAEFHDNCPECDLDKQEILNEEENVTQNQ